MISSGMSAFSMDVLGDGPDAVLGEAPERVLHHLEVGVEVPGPVLAAQLGEEGR